MCREEMERVRVIIRTSRNGDKDQEPKSLAKSEPVIMLCSQSVCCLVGMLLMLFVHSIQRIHTKNSYNTLGEFENSIFERACIDDFTLPQPTHSMVFTIEPYVIHYLTLWFDCLFFFFFFFSSFYSLALLFIVVVVFVFVATVILLFFFRRNFV